MRKWFAALALAAALLAPTLALAGGTILPHGRTQFFSATGQPLAGGSVSYFVPGTTSPQPTWQDPELQVLNSNPITLDSSGSALVYGLGNYRVVVEDANGNVVDDSVVQQLAGAVDSQDGAYLWGSLSGGTQNNYTINPSPTVTALVAGQTFRFEANAANTGAVTLNVSGTGAVPVTKQGATALVAGDIAKNQVVQVTFDGNEFQMTSIPNTIFPTLGVGLALTPPNSTLTLDGEYFFNKLDGLTLSDDALTPSTTIDISPGDLTDDTAGFFMTFPSPFTKTTAAFAAGSGNGCLDAGTIQDNKFYFVYAILRTDTGYTDFLCSNASNPAMPASYSVKRRVGTFYTDGSGNIVPFVQQDDSWLFTVPQADIATTTLGTTGTTFQLTVPGSIKVEARLRCTATGGDVLISSPDQTDEPVNTPTGNVSIKAGGAAQLDIRTDTTQHIRARASAASTTLDCVTLGWTDHRRIY